MDINLYDIAFDNISGRWNIYIDLVPIDNVLTGIELKKYNF